MSEDGLDLEVRGEYWRDAIQLAERLDISPSLLATQTLVGKIVGGEGNGIFAVQTADFLQSQGLLEHRLFTSLILKVKCSAHRVYM